MIVQSFPFIVVASFAGLGFWLESIGGKRGFIDQLLTPMPLTCVGVIYELTRRFAE